MIGLLQRAGLSASSGAFFPIPPEDNADPVFEMLLYKNPALMFYNLEVTHDAIRLQMMHSVKQYFQNVIWLHTICINIISFMPTQEI